VWSACTCGVLIAGLSAALPRWFLRFKFRRPAIKAFPFADLFRLYADLLRNLSGRQRAARIKPYPPGFVTFRVSLSCHAPAAPPFVCFSFFVLDVAAEVRKKTGHVQNMVRFQASGGVEECAARIVVFTFHNANYSRKNGQ
jgi:hypothetical protein